MLDGDDFEARDVRNGAELWSVPGTQLAGLLPLVDGSPILWSGATLSLRDGRTGKERWSYAGHQIVAAASESRRHLVAFLDFDERGRESLVIGNYATGRLLTHRVRPPVAGAPLEILDRYVLAGATHTVGPPPTVFDLARGRPARLGERALALLQLQLMKRPPPVVSEATTVRLGRVEYAALEGSPGNRCTD